MTTGLRIAFLVTPVGVGWLAGSRLSVGSAIAVFTLPAMVALALITEWNEHLLLRRSDVGRTRPPVATGPDADLELLRPR